MISRRSALKAALFGSTALAAGTAFSLFTDAPSRAGTVFINKLTIPPLLAGKQENGIRIFDLHMQKGMSRFFQGVQTPTLGVNGSFLGPTLKMRNGEKVRFNVTNTIGEPTTLHWHGLHLPAKADGGPHQIIENGETWSPEFEIKQMAATFWYHSHMFHKTGEQVWKGLAGLMLVEDETSDKLDLPREYGVDDIPVVLQDRSFNADGSLQYISSMHDIMMGMKGQIPMVNGTISPFIEATSKKLRLRILNGSNSRFFNLGFDDNRSFHQISTDGSFLQTPFETTRVKLGPGERAEIVVDVSGNQPFALRSAPSESSGGFMNMMRRGMGRGMMNMMGGGIEQIDFLQIRPAKTLKTSPALPSQLVTLPRMDAATAVKTRRFVMQMRMGPAMMTGSGGPLSINGKTMAMDRIDEVVKLGDTEIWQIENTSPLPHPFHVHNIQFLILERNGKPPMPGERGMKDTVTVEGGEIVRVIARFDDYADPEHPYMYHCHILEHEDAGMMGQFTVVA